MAAQLVFGANANLVGQPMELLTPNRGPVQTLPTLIEPSAYDHVVRSMADLPALSGGYYNLTDGSWAIAAPLTLGGALHVPLGGVVRIDGMGWDKVVARAGGTSVLQVDGFALLYNLTLQNTGTECVRMNHSSAELYVLECNIVATTRCIDVWVGDTLQVIGGIWSAAADGLYLTGNLDTLCLTDVHSKALTTNFVQYAGGNQGGARICQCYIEAMNGITWPAANIPLRGLSLVGNDFNCATPYNGFTQASARVNCKANLGPAGLLSETPIVP